MTCALEDNHCFSVVKHLTREQQRSKINDELKSIEDQNPFPDDGCRSIIL